MKRDNEKRMAYAEYVCFELGGDCHPLDQDIIYDALTAQARGCMSTYRARTDPEVVNNMVAILAAAPEAPDAS